MDGDGADRFGAFVNSLAEVVGHADRVPVFELALDMRRPARSGMERADAALAPT